MPQTSTEAFIALTLIYLALEVSEKHKYESTPWVVAFGFGLLHGLGFAGALNDIGVNNDALLFSLLFFNVGIEVGQLLVLPSIKAPMQGMIVKFDVKKGDEIWKGKPLLIMEAMKMEHEVLSSISGIVKEIKVQPQDTVFEGHSLMTIELAEVKEKATKKTKEVDLDRIRPDLKEALERKGAVGQINHSTLP